MSSKQLKVKLQSIEYQGAKIGSDLSLQFKLGDKQTLLNTQLKNGKKKVFNRLMFSEVLNYEASREKQSIPVEIQITEKDAVHADSGKSGAVWRFRPRKSQNQRFSLEVRVQGDPKAEAGAEARFIITFKAEISDYKRLVSARELRTLIRQKLGSRAFASTKILLSDPVYHLPAPEDIKNLVKRSKSDQVEGSIFGLDVDDYALRMKYEIMERSYSLNEIRQPLAAGILWGRDLHTGKRALIFVLTETSELLFIDPMSKDIFSPRGDDQQIYLLYA